MRSGPPSGPGPGREVWTSLRSGLGQTTCTNINNPGRPCSNRVSAATNLKQGSHCSRSTAFRACFSHFYLSKLNSHGTIRQHKPHKQSNTHCALLRLAGRLALLMGFYCFVWCHRRRGAYQVNSTNFQARERSIELGNAQLFKCLARGPLDKVCMQDLRGGPLC